MATLRQSGGDYSTLNSATAAGEVLIDVEGPWTIADTQQVVISQNNTIIRAIGESRNPGFEAPGGTYYRLQTSSGGDSIDINADNVEIDGICICLLSTGVSDEAIDFQGGNNLIVKNSIVRGPTPPVNQQDGIYCSNQDRTVSIEQTQIYNFAR